MVEILAGGVPPALLDVNGGDDLGAGLRSSPAAYRRRCSRDVDIIDNGKDVEILAGGVPPALQHLDAYSVRRGGS